MPVNQCNVFFYPRRQVQPILAGELRLLPGMTGTAFRYTADYLQHASAIAIDPFILQLRPDDAVTLRNGDAIVPDAFHDAGPDAWGRLVIDRALGGLERSSQFDYLLAAGPNRSGALDFSAGAIETAPSATHIADLSQIEAAIDRIRRRLPIEEHLRHLIAPGTSLGGVRPKTNLEHDGALWIAKFNSRDEDFDAVSVEYAGMLVAAKCGLNVPEVRKVAFSDSRAALLVRRFDREALDGSGYGRIPYVSARTLLNGYAVQALGEPLQDYSYPILAEAIRLIGTESKIAADLRELFARMVLNVLIDNTDDHERNHGFLRYEGGWGLSPAFDISPQHTCLGYQGMRIGRNGTEASLNNAVSECHSFGLDADEAISLVESLVGSTSDLADVYGQAGVDSLRIERLVNYRKTLVAGFTPKSAPREARTAPTRKARPRR